VDPVTGEKKTMALVDLDNLNQVTSRWDEALDRFVFVDANGVVIPPSDDDDSDDDALPGIRPRKPTKPKTPSPAPIDAVPRPKPKPRPMPPADERKERQEKVEREPDSASNEFSSNEEKGHQSVESLQREIAKLKHENASLRRHLGSSSGSAMDNVGSVASIELGKCDG